MAKPARGTPSFPMQCTALLAWVSEALAIIVEITLVTGAMVVPGMVVAGFVVAGSIVLPLTILGGTVSAATVDGETVVPGIVVVYVDHSPSALTGMALPTPAAVHCVGTVSVAVSGLEDEP